MRTTPFLPMDLLLADAAGAGAGLAAVARAAEPAGFDGCNLTDHPAPTAEWRKGGGHDARDHFAALSFAAAVTSGIMLITHITVLP